MLYQALVEWLRISTVALHSSPMDPNRYQGVSTITLNTIDYRAGEVPPIETENINEGSRAIEMKNDAAVHDRARELSF